jgi:hypothetical protein
MADSKFWRVLAVAAVAGVFYLGHGLHDPSDNPLPDLVSELHAGDVATAVHQNTARMKIITSSDQGRTIHVWNSDSTGGNVTFMGSYPAVKAKPK